MGARDGIQRLITKKEQELREYQLRIREISAYIQALQDSIKLLPRESGDGQPELRPGSALAKTRDLIKNGGKPLHVSDILKLLGKSTDKKNRVSLAGTLSSYARSGRIFVKTAPNTFSLIELNGANTTEEIEPSDEVQLPSTFGSTH
jgi:hypothetical protein